MNCSIKVSKVLKVHKKISDKLKVQQANTQTVLEVNRKQLQGKGDISAI